MITPEDVRNLVAVMPQVSEKDHNGQPSFSVADHVFAAFADGGTRVLLRLDEASVQRVVNEEPDTFTELTEGAKTTGVEVNLERVPSEQFAELLQAAWRHRAPAEIAHELDPED